MRHHSARALYRIARKYKKQLRELRSEHQRRGEQVAKFEAWYADFQALHTDLMRTLASAAERLEGLLERGGPRGDTDRFMRLGFDGLIQHVDEVSRSLAAAGVGDRGAQANIRSVHMPPAAPEAEAEAELSDALSLDDECSDSEGGSAALCTPRCGGTESVRVTCGSSRGSGSESGRSGSTSSSSSSRSLREARHCLAQSLQHLDGALAGGAASDDTNDFSTEASAGASEDASEDASASEGASNGASEDESEASSGGEDESEGEVELSPRLPTPPGIGRGGGESPVQPPEFVVVGGDPLEMLQRQLAMQMHMDMVSFEDAMPRGAGMNGCAADAVSVAESSQTEASVVFAAVSPPEVRLL